MIDRCKCGRSCMRFEDYGAFGAQCLECYTKNRERRKRNAKRKRILKLEKEPVML